MRDEGCDRLIVDVGRIPYLSSETLSLLLLIRSGGVPVGIRNASPYVREVLATTHLDRFFPATAPGEDLEPEFDPEGRLDRRLEAARAG